MASRSFTPTVTSTPTLTPRATPHPLAGYTIEELGARQYLGGTIQMRFVLTTALVYTRYHIAYPSDDLTITGVIHVPHDQGLYRPVQAG